MSSTRTARRLSAIAAPLLLAASLTACGGDDSSGAPEDASKEDFCKVYKDDGDMESVGQEGTAKEKAKKIVDILKEATDRLADTGTPKDIPDDARDGFEVLVDTIGNLDDDKVAKAIEDNDTDFLEKAVDKDEEKKVEAFTKWANDYCA
jgi:hypothetical protein